jgi:phosphonate transport system permease protein
VAAAALASLEAKQARFGLRRLRLGATLLAVAAFYTVCFSLAKVDPARLITGLPKIVGWLAQAWPPRVDELPLIVQRTAETIAMAAVGTTAAALLALPIALQRSRQHRSSKDG